MTETRLLLAAAPAPRPARLLWRSSMPPEVIRHHDDQSPLPAIQLIQARGLLWGGRGLPARGGELAENTGIEPSYVQQFLGLVGRDHGTWRLWVGGLLSPNATRVRHDGPVVVAVHANWGWGHFLVEVLPRLILLHEGTPAEWPVALASGGPAWVRAMVEAAAPGRPILSYEPATEAVEAPLLVGCEEPAYQARIRPALRSRIAAFKARVISDLPPPEAPLPRRIWVSRVGLAGVSRHLVREVEVEREAEARDFALVKPEMLTLADQVRLFDAAEVVAGQYGSGLHNTIFSREGTTVVALNWINMYQSNLASSLGHVVGYVLPDDGKIRDARAVLGGGGKRLPFSPRRVGNKLDAALAQAARA